MTHLSSHITAQPSHYDKEAKHYDTFNEKSSESTNRFIESMLQKYQVKSVLDLTCGTGSQVFWLSKRGYDVVGVDINAKMLSQAKRKAKKEKRSIPFLQGDMRTVKAGEFDAAITIFNAIGHLTKKDFEKAIRNIHRNLKKGGIYIFDIFNLNYLLAGDNITKLTIDWQKQEGDTTVREIQFSTITQDGVLASYTTSCAQQKNKKLKVTESAQTLQVYSAKQLKAMLEKCGFRVLRQCGIDGTRLNDKQTERIVTIARK